MSLSDKQLLQRIDWGISRIGNHIEEGEATLVHLQMVRDDLSERIAAGVDIDPPVVVPPAPVPEGIWISRDELQALPTSGPAWEATLADAERDHGRADLGDQNSRHDVWTLAAALVAARTGDYAAKARQGVIDAIGTEMDPSDADGVPIPSARWMSIGRNMGSYVIAADLLNLRPGPAASTSGERVFKWIEGFKTKLLPHNNSPYTRRLIGGFHGSANGAQQEGFVLCAIAAYLRDDVLLAKAWNAFQVFCGDKTVPDDENIYLDKSISSGWSAPGGYALNPLGATIQGHDVDGALTGDMRRGSEPFAWPPTFTQYPWVGLEGLVPAALILHRQGFPAFEIQDRAILRAVDFLWRLRLETGDERWFDGKRASYVIQITNHIYGTTYPIVLPVGSGRTAGYTDWTHPG